MADQRLTGVLWVCVKINYLLLVFWHLKMLNTSIKWLIHHIVKSVTNDITFHQNFWIHAQVWSAIGTFTGQHKVKYTWFVFNLFVWPQFNTQRIEWNQAVITWAPLLSRIPVYPRLWYISILSLYQLQFHRKWRLRKYFPNQQSSACLF